jgi:hypothetical protein
MQVSLPLDEIEAKHTASFFQNKDFDRAAQRQECILLLRFPLRQIGAL